MPLLLILAIGSLGIGYVLHRREVVSRSTIGSTLDHLNNTVYPIHTNADDPGLFPDKLPTPNVNIDRGQPGYFETQPYSPHPELDIREIPKYTPPKPGEVDWSRVRYFKPHEFHGLHDQIEPELIYALDEFRHQLGVRVDISGDPRAVARHDKHHSNRAPAGWRGGTSYHGTGGGKYKAKAIDVHPNVPLRQAYDTAKRIPQIDGIGVYPDTRRPLIHIDVAGRKAEWIRYGASDYQPYIDWGYIKRKGV